MNQRQLLALALVAVAIWVFTRKAKAAGAAPAVAGTVSSGSRSATIDTNVLSDTFGEVIPGDVGVGSETP